MEKKQRQHIEKNLDRLIHLTNYENLMTECVNNGLLTSIMRQNIEDMHDELHDEQLQLQRLRSLWLKLTKRGPTAYVRLKSILSNLNCNAALRILNEPTHNESQFMPINPGICNQKTAIIDQHMSQRPQQPQQKQQQTNSVRIINDNREENLGSGSDFIPDNSRLQQYVGPIKTEEYKVKKSQKLFRDDKVGCYPMQSQHNRGVFFCVNIIDFPKKEDYRGGALKDSNSLLYLYQELGFKLFYYENLTQKEFVHLLDLMLQSEHTRDTECFVMVLMTHGESTGEYEHVEFTDGAMMKVREIEARFDNGVCTHLLRKPKILIFPFCRGKIKDFDRRSSALMMPQQKQQVNYIQTDSISNDDLARAAPVPTYSDMLISYASLRGFTSHRDPIEGSWYIQSFCQLMAEHAHDTSFDNILKLTQNKMMDYNHEGAIQMPSFQNIGFSKKLYFNPGFWLEPGQ